MHTKSSNADSTTQRTSLLSGKVVPFGYAGQGGMARLQRLMQDPKAYLVDIRLVPQSSWHKAFNKRALAQQFPKRYMHMPELGNLHYRPEDRQKGIQLANPERGVARLMKGLEKGYTLILLCACQNKGCHRWEVVKLLSDAMLGNTPLVQEGN